MANSYLEIKVSQALGVRFLSQSCDDFGSWSPNLVKRLLIDDSAIQVDLFTGESRVLSYDSTTARSAGGAARALRALERRAFGNLEELSYPEDLVVLSQDVLDQYLNHRLHLLNGEEIGYEGWEGRVHALPETYPADSQVKDLVGEGFTVESEPEKPKPEETTPEDLEREIVREVATEKALGHITRLLDAYDLIFASGYEILRPYGVLSVNDQGRGVALRLSGSSLKPTKYAGAIQDSFDLLQQYLHLEIRNTRNIREIVQEVLSAPNGVSFYYPKKMLEYAYGRERAEKTKVADTDYPKNANEASWEDYKRKELAPSLEDVYQAAAYVTIKEAGLLHDVTSNEARSLIDQAFEKITKAMGTVLLVSKYETLKGRPSQLKIRVLDPTRSLPVNKNLATEAIVMATSSTGGVNSQSFEVVADGTFYEYYHQTDRALANAAPLFAYKALQSLQERGIQPSMENLILGIGEDDSILQAGPGGIDLATKLIHWIIAGSRAGKGVMTQNVLASGLGSNKPLFYLDRAPDISSTLLKLNPDAFVVNGGSMLTGEGRDHWGAFQEASQWVNWDHVPDYVPSNGVKGRYEAYGDLFYTRALLLVMGILAARVDYSDRLGGPGGIMVVIDELKNASDGLQTMLADRVQSDYHPETYQSDSEYLEAVKEWEDGGKEGPKPSVEGRTSKATEGTAWFTDFLDSLKESFRKMSAMSSAGMKDVESGRSDIFVLSQKVHDTSNSAFDVFPKRNKNSFGVAFKFDKYDVLASLIAVTGAADAFLGYNKDDSSRNILRQLTSGSYSSSRLDSKARKFAYLENFNETVIERLSTHEIEKSATYFKPFLLFADGREDQYFVQNARSFIQAAGINWSDVVLQNESTTQPGTLNEQVGFEEYIKAMGLASPSDTLQTASDIANYVVKAMGYPGQWRDFIFDLRPQWIFSVTDVIQAVSGDGIRPASQRIPETARLFPELSGSQESGSSTFGSSTGWDTGSGYSYDDPEDDPEDDTSSGDASSTGSSGTFSRDEPIDLFGNSTGPSGGPSGPAPTGTPFNPFPTPDQGSYGRGTYTSPSGSTNHFEPLPEREVPLPGVYDGSQESFDLLRSAITRDIIGYCGGAHMVRSIAVIGSSLIINAKAHKIRPTGTYQTSLPEGIKAELDAGNLAGYFSWSALSLFPNLVSLEFDSPSFVYDTVGPEMGWTGRMGVSDFFNSLPSLNRLSIGGYSYDRMNLRRQLKMGDPLQAPSRANEIANVSEQLFAQGTRGSWRFTTNLWKRRDIGFFTRVLGSTVGLTGAAASGAGYVGTKAVRTLGDAVRQGISMIQQTRR